MNQINKLFIHTTWACNMDCPSCYIPKDLRYDYASRLNANYLSKTLKHPSIDQSDRTVAIYMGGEPSIIGEKKLREYMDVVIKELPNARHTMVTNLFNLPKWLVKISANEFSCQIETTYANGGKQTLGGSESKYQQKFIKNLTTVTQAGINPTVNLELNIETIQAGIQPIINIMKESSAKDWAFDYSVNFNAFNHNPIYDRFDRSNKKASVQAVWTCNMFSKRLLSTLSTFGFQAIEIPFKSSQLIDTDIRCSFKPKDGANLSTFALNHLFEKKMGFDGVHKDIKALYPNIAFISVVFDQEQQNYKTLKLYIVTHSTHSQHQFKKVAGEQCTSIFSIIKKYKLLSLCGLDLNKDNAKTLNKKIYLDTQEVNLTRETREELLQDLDKKLLKSLPELMSVLNFNQEKQDKINKTIAHMQRNKLPLSSIGIDIDSHEIKLYFDYGQ